MKKGFLSFSALLFGFSLIVLTLFYSNKNTNFEIISNQTLIEEKQDAPVASEISRTQNNLEQKQKIVEKYGDLPIIFEPNKGQTDEQVKFLARGDHYGLFLTNTEAVLSLEKSGKNKKQAARSVIKMQIEGANADANAVGVDETESKSNYFIGSDSEKWQTNVSNFQKVKYESIYEGVDLVYYGNGRQLEYDFVVAPNADAKQIKLKFDGVESAQIEKSSGDLLLETGVGTLRQLKPFVYQMIDGERREIAAAYKLTTNDERPTKDKGQRTKNDFSISFSLAEYDQSKELIIDPILAYGSYLGGNLFDEARGIAVDASGNAYVVGTAASRDFPTTAGTVKPVLLPRIDAPNSFWYDAFVTKINPAGTAIVYSTYFGGRSGNESGGGATVDANGNVIFTGTTMASDFPTVNAYQATLGGADDSFAVKLNQNGSAIIYSTYLGGNGSDAGSRIALDAATGDAIFAGSTSSPNFPTTAGAYKPRLCSTLQSCSGIFYSGSYLVKLSANGAAQYSTLFDAGISDVTLDASNNAVLAGSASSVFPATAGAYQTAHSGGADGFVAKMNPTGNTLIFGTFLGGGLQSDRISAIALDANQNIYVTGQTQNTGFPVTAGAFDTTFNGVEDAFVSKLNASGSTLLFSTFLGGTGRDQPFSIGLGTDNSIFVAGETVSNASFPLRNPLLQNGSIFLTRFNPNGDQLVFSTFLGVGGAYDLIVDNQNNAYLTGHTTSILTSPDAFQPVKGDPTSTSSKDGFVLKIAPTDENQTFYTISGTVNDTATFSQDQTPLIATITGTVNRSITLAYSGNGMRPYSFGNLPAGGNYTISVRKNGYATDPESATFNNLGANQFADFTILGNQEPVGVITSPTHATQFPQPATITIQATASDPDGHAITKVEFSAYHSDLGSIPLGVDTTAPYEFTWENVPLGTWSLNATPVDELGLRGYSTPVVHVTVVDPTGANIAFVSPTTGQTFIQGGVVPIEVSVSSSVNLVEVRDQNDNLVARMTAAPWTRQWHVMETGTYTLKAKAWTQTGQTAETAPVSITVNPLNHRISGKIIDNISLNGIGGITVNLVSQTNPNITATATTDSGGNYLFTDLGTTPNDGVTITPVSSNHTFDPPTKTIFYLGFIEWTNQNFFADIGTQIDVQMTSPTNGQTFTAPATINLAATATSGAGAITKVEFLQRNRNGSTTLLATDTTAPYEHQLVEIPVGDYQYLARATDSTNAVAETANIAVIVKLPTVTMSGRITNQSGNGVAGVTVYIGGGMAWTEETDQNGNFTFADYPGGQTYHFTPSPANGITYTPVSRSYTNVTNNISNIDFIASAPNQPPTLQFNSPTNGATYTMPAPIPLNVAASDPDNNIQNVRVIANNGSFSSTIVQTTNSTINTTWQPTQPGNYVLTAIVRDNGGLQASQEISITVNQPAPVAVSGRIVNRDSEGIEGVTLELVDYPQEKTVAATATTDANGRYTIPNITTFQNYVLRASKLNYTFSPAQRLYFNIAANQTNGDYTGTLALQPSDFDGDARSDIAVWRPSTGDWHIMRSNTNSYTGVRFGAASLGDIAVPGNYDGDQKIDAAVFRNGNWYILNSSNGQVRGVAFGVATDKPVPADYDGDGKTDIAVFRPSNGHWYILRSSDGGFTATLWGLETDKPLCGDFDGDGLSDIAVFRPSNGYWYIRQSSDGNLRALPFGAGDDVPLVGDFDGDRKADITVFRPSNGYWYTIKSSDGEFKAFLWGNANDIPVAGDYDLDGKTDYAVFRKTDGNWYVFKSSNNTYFAQPFGTNGDIPIPAAAIR